jgi:hypothetical protein
MPPADTIIVTKLSCLRLLTYSKASSYNNNCAVCQLLVTSTMPSSRAKAVIVGVHTAAVFSDDVLQASTASLSILLVGPLKQWKLL